MAVFDYGRTGVSKREHLRGASSGGFEVDAVGCWQLTIRVLKRPGTYYRARYMAAIAKPDSE